MPAKRVEHLIDVERIPTLPLVAMEVIRLMEGEASTFDTIGELIKNDQVLTAKILKYANSAHLGARRTISTIPHAISTAGLNAVRSVVLSVAVFDTFSDVFTNHRQSLVNFWLHSVGVAVTAEVLAGRMGYPAPEEAYVGGLIHDLGKLVCFMEFPDEFAELCRQLAKQGSLATKGPTALDLEQHLLGLTHIDAGRVIGGQYGFPDFLRRVMWLHHQPVVEPIQPVRDSLPQLVRFADVLCVTHHVGYSYFLGADTTCHENYHYSLENLARLHHFEAEDIREMMAEVHQRVETVSTVLGCWDDQAYWRLVGSANIALGEMGQEAERENQELTATNRVLNEVCQLPAKIYPGQTLVDAVRAVADCTSRAFGIDRCLCLLLDGESGSYVGCSLDGGSYHNFELPVDFHDRENDHEASSSLEKEAVNRLGQVRHDLLHGRTENSRMLNIITGSSFMATFFTAGESSRWRREDVLGELVVDFGTGQGQNRSRQSLARDFEVMASAAGTALERLLLEKDLLAQSREMAETSRKMEESQHQMFQSYRLATVGRLAAGAAHEINNPLTIVSLNLQLLKRLLGETAENKDVQDRLKVLAEQEGRISAIIQDLMDFARPSEPSFAPVDPGDFVGRALSLVIGKEKLAEVELDNRIKGELPLVLVDQKQLEQVFVNLLLNADQAMADGGSLVVDGETDADSVVITITDSGQGIAREDIGKIFDPFFTTREEGEGTGLGLAVAHSIVEHNGGRMRVASQEGHGTTFQVILPRDKTGPLREMKEVMEAPEPVPEPAPEPSVVDPRLLVIDDERVLNDILQETLRAAGYKVDGAYDGFEGIEKLRQRPYELVLLDIRMPRRDGLDVLKVVKDDYPDCKVIIITGLASLPEIKETVRLGAYACLKKPFLLDRVLEIIDKAMAGRGRANG